jgi:hypothetical protein
MALHLLVKISSKNASWEQIYNIAKVYIPYNYEFFPIDEKFTNGNKFLGVSILSDSVNKENIVKFICDFLIIDGIVVELYNGSQLTSKNIDLAI